MRIIRAEGRPREPWIPGRGDRTNSGTLPRRTHGMRLVGESDVAEQVAARVGHVDTLGQHGPFVRSGLGLAWGTVRWLASRTKADAQPGPGPAVRLAPCAEVPPRVAAGRSRRPQPPRPEVVLPGGADARGGPGHGPREVYASSDRMHHVVVLARASTRPASRPLLARAAVRWFHGGMERRETVATESARAVRRSLLSSLLANYLVRFTFGIALPLLWSLLFGLFVPTSYEPRRSIFARSRLG